MTDIVERLQKRASQAGMLLSDPPKPSPDMTLCTEAAALIASQAARIAELEGGLEPFAKAGGVKLCGEWRDDERFGHTDVTFYLTFGDLRRARSLLTRKGGE